MVIRQCLAVQSPRDRNDLAVDGPLWLADHLFLSMDFKYGGPPGPHRAVDPLVGLAAVARAVRDARPDLLAITGDVFDSASLAPDVATARFSELHTELCRALGRDVPTVIVPGITTAGGADCSARVGVTIDTQHAWACGYDWVDHYDEVWESFESTVGRKWLVAFHLNDSKQPCGARLDRHDAIGKGLLGPEFWRRLVNDRRLDGLPGYLETPDGVDSWRQEIAFLRGLRAA